MKKYILLALALALFASPAQAITVTCTNCSTNLVQMLDRITNNLTPQAANNLLAFYN